MSTAKRSRRRPADGQSVSPQRDAKRSRLTKSPHVPVQNGLGFLVDENTRSGKKLNARLTNGVSTSKATHVNDARAIVAKQIAQDDEAKQKGKKPSDIIDVSSDDDSSSIDDDEDEDEDEDVADDVDEEDDGQELHGQGAHPLTNGHISGVEDEDRDDREDDTFRLKSLVRRGAPAVGEEGPSEEATFGDLLKARHPEPIDIGGSGPSQALVPATDQRGIVPPSSTSLGTVLTQALKTNDAELLESCLRLTDLPSIRSTIQRLPSQHVATLLQRIVERMHKRPGRTGSLMVWIQWSLVAHGAYLANQPDVMRKVQSLAHVIRERANGLQPLLHLKGKLDLLSAQLELRRSLTTAASLADEEDDEDEALYLEGDDDDDGSESDVVEGAAGGVIAARTARPSRIRKGIAVTDGHAQSNGVVNGVRDDSSDDDEDVDAEDDDELLDIEAAEAIDEEEEDDERDSDEEADSDMEDMSVEEDESSEAEESETEVRPPKPQTLQRKR